MSFLSVAILAFRNQETGNLQNCIYYFILFHQKEQICNVFDQKKIKTTISFKFLNFT